MTNATDFASQSWDGAHTAKTRSAVQRSVTALLDRLAPERALKRVDQLQGPIEQHRTPNGCLLQAAACAVSVSWFPDSTKYSALGELHILVWQGTVTRRGAPKTAKNAALVSELILRPIESPADDALWLAKDGARYGTALLADRCLELLAAQIEHQG